MCKVHEYSLDHFLDCLLLCFPVLISSPRASHNKCNYTLRKTETQKATMTGKHNSQVCVLHSVLTGKYWYNTCNKVLINVFVS